VKNLFLLLIFIPVFSFSQTSFFVALEANGGSDSLNTGTINSPFKTINKALSMMNSGDTCFVRSGIYHEEVIISGKNDIVITSYNNEFVCFEGTQQINSNWIPYNGNIFQTNLSKHIWQLFVDNNQMVMARWPNANFIDSSIYNLNSWASGVVDSVSGYPNGSYNGFELVDTSKFDLGLTGLNVTGAIGIMNVGSFKTYNREITSHNANDNFFNYNTVPNSSYRDKHHNFYLEGKLDLLDQANEWFYDTTSKTLYLYPEDGQNPNGRIIKGKVQDYAISINNSNNVTINNLYFFATTFFAKSSSEISVINCNFSYPNCSKRMLKDFLSSPNVSSLGAPGNMNKVNNSIISKCLFEHTDGEALRVYGDNNLIENCYMRFIDYSVSELPFLMVGLYINGDSNRFIHNTVHHSTASAFIAPGTSPEFAYNEVYATGFLQSDGSVYQGTAATVQNSNIHHNYIHDTKKYALRFDAPGGAPGQAGQYGKMHHNIAVRTNGIMVKGNHHYICHNTTFSSNKNGLIILDEDNSNDSSYIFNNFSEKMSAHRAVQASIPGIHSNNWNGYTYPNTNFYSLIDTVSYLPLINSSLIDSGVTISAIPHQVYNTAPDIGALEFGIIPWETGVSWNPIHFPWLTGCTDLSAPNYNPNANVDDGSCIVCDGDTNYTTVNACDSYTWPINNQTYTSSLVDSLLLASTTGCDSIVVLDLTINPSTSSIQNTTECDSYTWPLNNQLYTSTGVYIEISTNTNGCVNTDTLDLTINSSTSSYSNQTECDNYLWPVNNQLYTSSGVYVEVNTNSNGCVNRDTLNLTINPSSSSTLTTIVCDSYNWNGNTYISSGIYSFVFTSITGCDSIAVLDLTINPSTSSVQTTTECDSYTWPVNNQMYTSSGLYVDVNTNSNGCVNTDTLDLTINPSSSSTLTTSECDSYNWNGSTYTSSGVYSLLLVSSTGCDSITTLDLTINDSTSSITTLAVCDSYIWPVNNQMYTSSGVYVEISTNASGCVNTDTLDLTINPITSTTQTTTECDSYNWNGSTYTTSGVYSLLLVSSTGCDSTAILDLTINNSYSTSLNIDICAGDSVIIGGTPYYSSGSYNDVYVSVNGCDSTVTTNLTVSTAFSVAIIQQSSELVVNVSGGAAPYGYFWSTGESGSQITPTVNGLYWIVVSDQDYCYSDTVYYTVDWIKTSVEEIGVDYLRIYPNPSKDIFNIEFTSLRSQDVIVRVYNVIGEQVLEYNIQNIKGKHIKSFNLNQYNRGIYLLDIATNKGIIHRKITLK